MKLDSFSKIQIATFGIQYTASSMQVLAIDIDRLADMNPEAGFIPNPFDAHLQTISEKLAAIYEEVVNLLNAHDAISTIDINLLERPSDILLFGMDDTEHDYYSGPVCPGCGVRSDTIMERPDFNGPDVCDSCYEISKMTGE